MNLLRTLLCLCLTLSVLPACAQTDSGHDEEARALFTAGQTAFDNARFEDALNYFQRAYELSGRAALLYNVAVAADRLRRDVQAIEAFEAFLANSSPNAPRRRDAEVRLNLLRQARASSQPAPPPQQPQAQPTAPVATQAQTSSPTAPSDTAPTNSDSGGNVAPWVVLGVGGALAAGGAVLLTLGQLTKNDIEGSEPGRSFTEVRDQVGTADAMTIAGIAALGLGVAAAVGGISWALTGSDSDQDVALELEILPGGIQLEGTF